MGNIVVIGSRHPLYSGIDEKLRKYCIVRFAVNVSEDAAAAFKRLARHLSAEGLTYGTAMMLGYDHLHKKVQDYFVFGVNPDIAHKTHSSLIDDFDKTLETILVRDRSAKKHDGAFLFSPEGLLYHGGAGFSVSEKFVFKAYGTTYYRLKKELGIEHEGGFRLMSAIAHSLIFPGAIFASISSKYSESHDYLIKDGTCYRIER
jgi:hypothetical protein